MLTLLTAAIIPTPHGLAASPPACATWRIVPSPGAASPNAYLEGVGGSAGNDVWAVGHRSDYSDGKRYPLFRHWNGRSWTAVTAPARPGQFRAVAAISPTDAWAVGDGPTIAHWNGTAWSLVASPSVTRSYRQPALLRSIAALSPTNIWAAGFNWHYHTLQLIEHWNGRRWRVIPGVPTGRHELAGIAALSATDIWAVGHGIQHWNGSRWISVPAPADASTVTAIAPDDIWAAGGATIEHWNGSVWSIVPTPASGDRFTVLTGIAAIAAGDVWAVGYAGRTIPHDGYAEHPFVEHWDGTAWRIVSTPATGSPDSQLLAVAFVPPRTLWSVGFAGMHRAGGDHPLIERTCLP